MSLPNTVKIIKEILEPSFKEWNVLQYSCEKDFKAMWGLEGENLGHDQKFVILWDGIDKNWADDSSARLEDFLTPIDWALAYTIGQGNGLKMNGLNIVILDVYSHQFSDRILDFHHDVLDKMRNWVRFYSVNDNSHLSIRSSIKGWDNSENAEQQFQPLLESWQNSLKKIVKKGKKYNSHHNINNILGPMFLLQKKEHTTSHQNQAFRQLLEWLGIVKVELEDIRNNERTDFDILAIDDKLSDGWAEVLQKMFGLKSKPEEGRKFSKFASSEDGVHLWGSADPEELLISLLPDIEAYKEAYGEPNIEAYKEAYKERDFDSLIGLLQDKEACKKIYGERDFDSPISSKRKPWFLVLDLHLYSEKEKELEFFGKCFELVKLITGVENLAWEGFDDFSELEEVEVDEFELYLRNNSKAYENAALSLLPRLCALRWPSVPIFVFSVTGKRDLMAIFSQYGNIFPAYSKPNFLEGNADDQIEAFNYYWKKEFLAAKNLIDVQRKLIGLSKWSPNNDNQGCSEGEDEPECRHVVIALDETGPGGPKITHIGGVILISEGNNHGEAEEASREFEKRVHEKNKYCEVPSDFMYPTREYTQDEVTYKFKKDPLTKWENFRKKLGFFTMELDTTNRSNIDEAFEDNIYLHGLSSIIEVLLAEFIPSVGIDDFSSRSERTKICIWLPTKQCAFSFNDEKAGKQAWKYDLKNMPVSSGDGQQKILLQTIGGTGSAYSVLLRALGERNDIFINRVLFSLKFIKARKILYSARNSAKRKVPDWVCPQHDAVVRARVKKIDEFRCRILVCGEEVSGVTEENGQNRGICPTHGTVSKIKESGGHWWCNVSVPPPIRPVCGEEVSEVTEENGQNRGICPTHGTVSKIKESEGHWWCDFSLPLPACGKEVSEVTEVTKKNGKKEKRGKCPKHGIGSKIKGSAEGRLRCGETSALCQLKVLPDYSVLQHLADRMLKALKEDGQKDDEAKAESDYCRSIVDKEYCFNVEEKALKAFLECARVFDRSSEEESSSTPYQNTSFKIAYENNFFTEHDDFLAHGEYSEIPSSVNIESRLVRKIQDYSKKVDGNTLIQLAGLTKHSSE